MLGKCLDSVVEGHCVVYAFALRFIGRQVLFYPVAVYSRCL
jgi:hypothetical protein